MLDIVLEFARALVVGIILAYFIVLGKREGLEEQKGWKLIVAGFSLLFFGMLIDITDNFPVLNVFWIIGDTPIQSFLEKIVGYSLGFTLLALGFWMWMPTVIQLRLTQLMLEEHFAELEAKVKVRTASLNKTTEELKRENEERRRSEEKFRNLIESSSDWIWEMGDLEQGGVYKYSSPQAQWILGYSPDELEGTNPYQLMPAEETERVKPILSGLIAEAKPIERLETVHLHKNRNKIVLETSGVPFFDLEGKVIGYRGVTRDITERKEMEDRLRYLANHDILTSLFNRHAFDQKLSEEVDRADRYKHELSLFILDIDFFKRINDTYGHSAGDTVLYEFAALLKGSLRKTDYAARYGGEEFVVLLPETPFDQALELAERLRKLIEDHLIDVNGISLNLTSSIGIATFPDHARTSGDLVNVADQAMYEAKHSGRNQVKTA